MMPLPSSRHNKALDAPTAYTRRFDVTFTRGSDTVTLAPTDGSFTQDARRGMMWSGEINIDLPIDSPLLPVTPTDILTPFGTIVTIETGARLVDGTDSLVPYGEYVVTSVNVNATAESRNVRLSLADKALALADYRCEVPLIVAGGDVATVVNTVVLDRLGFNPGLSASGETVGSTIFGLDPEKNPWDELQSVAASRELRLRYNRAGTLELTPQPSYATTLPTPLTGSLAVSASFEARPANVIVARGEPADGSTPVVSIAMDDDESSPTYAGATPGSTPYGRITKYYASPLLTSQGQADGAAATILARQVGAGASWSLSRTFDPTLDIDDLLNVGIPGIPSLAVDSVTVSVRGETIVEARAVTA